LVDERSKQLAYDAAELIFDAAFESGRIEVVAAERNLPVKTTDFFTRQGPQKGIQKKADFAKVAFDLAEDEVSEIQDFGDGYYLMEIVGKLPSRIPELKEVETKVKADLIEEKKSEKAKMDAEALLSALKDGKVLKTAAKEFGLTPASTGFFKRTDAIPNIGFERDFSRVAFELSGDNRLPQKVIQGRKGYYVIQFRQKQPPSMVEFDKEKDDIIERLLQQKRSKVFAAWLEQVKNRSEIVYFEDFLQS
jgi:peptidyl-prolyl cis-trans isomerase D